MSDFLGRDTDPVDHTRVAEPAREQALPKRFYETVSVVGGAEGHEVRLDGRPVRTPGRALLAFANEELAEAVALEWRAQTERIDPVTMPLTRLANTALDGTADVMDEVRDDIVRFAGTDLVCYRADGPEGLAAREAEAWDPYIAWARSDLGAPFVLAQGIVHVTQPDIALEAFARKVAAFDDPMALTGLHSMTSLTGSAVIALAVALGERLADEAWAHAHIDEDWNAEQWGRDEEADARREQRWLDMQAAALMARG